MSPLVRHNSTGKKSLSPEVKKTPRAEVLKRRDPTEHQFSPALMQPPLPQDTKARAIETLEALHKQGQLKPVDGFPLSETLNTYLDILGLNDRDMASNARSMRA